MNSASLINRKAIILLNSPPPHTHYVRSSSSASRQSHRIAGACLDTQAANCSAMEYFTKCLSTSTAAPPAAKSGKLYRIITGSRRISSLSLLG